MKLFRNDANVRHTSVCRLVEYQPPSRQTKVCRTSIQTFALLIFMVVSVFPLYGQSAQLPESTYEQINEDSSQGNAISRTDVPVCLPSGTFLFKESAGEVKSVCEVESTQPNANQTTNQQATQPYVFPTRRERVNRYVKSTVGPFSLINAAVSAGLNQWRDNPEEWEQGASGYGKRFASSFGRHAIQQTVIYGLDSAMGWDTGFKRSERKGFFPRMKDALAENITSRNRSGKRVVSVPRISGIYASKIISVETWYPKRYDYKDGLRSGTRSLLTGFAMNLVREFIINW
jgi:hypothetical protein